MTYIEIKTVYGKQYKYLRKTVWNGEKYLHVNLKYLGPTDPIYKIKRQRKSNASLYVRQLEQCEIEILEKETKSTNAFRKERAKIILLSAKGFTSKEIAGKISCGIKKVRVTIKTFNTKGLKISLERRKSKGRPPRFTKEQRAKILQTILTEPVRLGLHFTTWSLPSIKKYLIDSGIVEYICIESIRNILKSEKSNYKKSKRRLYSNDPDFYKKKLEKDRLKESPPANNSVVLSFDEKGCIAIKQFDGRKWMMGKQYYFVPERQKVKGLLNFFCSQKYPHRSLSLQIL